MYYRDKYRGKKVGTFIIDRRFKGIGRIKRASGTSNTKTFRDINRMLTDLYDLGKRTILEEIQKGVLSPMQVYGFWKEGRLKHVPSGLTLLPVHPTIPDWIDTHHDGVDTTKRNYKSEMTRFCRVVGENLPIQDLPTGFRRYQKYCVKRGIEVSAQKLKTVLLSYLNKTLGKSHTLYQKVSEIAHVKVSPKRKVVHLSVGEFYDLVEQLPEADAAIAYAMMMTGMHWKELEGVWECKKDRISISGTKNVGRRRDVPLLLEIERPTKSNQSFRAQLKKVRPDLSPIVFRRTYAFWMAEAEIMESRRNTYMGHVVKSSAERYARTKADPFLLADAQKLSSWIIDQASRHSLKSMGATFVDEEVHGPMIRHGKDTRRFVGRLTHKEAPDSPSNK